MIYYSIKEICEAYDITPDALKYRIKHNKIMAVKICWNNTNTPLYRYSIPQSELAKLEYCRVHSPQFSLQSQPEYWQKKIAEDKIRREKIALARENRLKSCRTPQLAEFYKNGYYGYLEYIHHSLDWRILSGKRKAYDGYKCQHCGRSDVSLQCHHKTYKHLYMHSEFFDLITLCDHCHREVHEHQKNM